MNDDTDGDKKTVSTQPAAARGTDSRSVFDAREFAYTLREIKADRTVASAALLLNVSPSFLSKALTGHISQPSLRTVERLLSAQIPSSLKQRLIQSSGFTQAELSCDSAARLEIQRQSFSVSANLGTKRSLSGDLFSACALVMQALAQNGTPPVSIRFYQNYFVFNSGAQELVCVNIENANEMEGVFYLAYMLGALTELEQGKAVIITVSSETLYNAIRRLRFDDMPVALLALSDGERFIDQSELKGISPVSLITPERIPVGASCEAPQLPREVYIANSLVNNEPC